MPFYKTRWWKPEACGSTPADTVQHIKAIAPQKVIKNPNQPLLATTQVLSAMDELICPICLDVLRQPIQLPCDRLVFATCLIEWIHLNATYCPCCHSTTPLTSKNLKPAVQIIQLLLYDVMVCCRSCDRSIKAIEYDSHRCTESVTRQEMQLVSKVVHKMLDASKENIIQINTGGTVSK